MKEGSLLCFCKIHQTGMFLVMFFGVFGKLLMRTGAWAWFHDVWTLMSLEGS
jgi:hypothetical protein